MKTRALITGSTGLVGSHLAVELLQNGGYEVYCTARGEKSVEKLKRVCEASGVDFGALSVHYVDLHSAEEIKAKLEELSIEVVFHTAAVVSVSGEHSDSMVYENVSLCEAVAEAMVEYGKAVMVHVSSIAAIGSAKTEGGFIDEKCEIVHSYELEPYGLSKFLSENVIWKMARIGVKVAVVNPSVVLGVSGQADGSDGLQGAVKMLWRGIPFYTKAEMGFVDVRDVASAMERLGARLLNNQEGIASERFIISGHNLTYRELIGAFARQAGVREPKILMRKWMLRLGIGIITLWCKITGKRPLVGQSMVGYATSKSRYSNAKLLGVLSGFKFREVADTVAMIAERTHNL